MPVKKMDQATYLSQTLWQFLEASVFTDLRLVCKDGEVAAHSPMLASLLLKVGFSCLSADQERPGCLLMPDSIPQPPGLRMMMVVMTTSTMMMIVTRRTPMMVQMMLYYHLPFKSAAKGIDTV